jgi:hypothetical protein
MAPSFIVWRANGSDLRFLFDLASGTVTMRFLLLDANSTSPRGSS